jgi:CHAT domain-containing protein
MLKDPARAHPYYWASFIAIGEEKALSEVARMK